MDNSTQYEISVPSSRMTLFYDEIYSSGLDRTARFPVDRYSMIAQKITEEDRDGLIELKQPRLAKREEVLLAHDAQFVDRFLAQQLREDEIRRIGLRPWNPEIVERTMRLVGGAIEGLDLLQAGVPIAGNMAGGTHHAFRGEGAGYCIFNDLAVCAEVALQRGQAERVLCLIWMFTRGMEPRRFLRGMTVYLPCPCTGRIIFHSVKRATWTLACPKGQGTRFLSAVDRAIEEVSGQSFDHFFEQGWMPLGKMLLAYSM